jgi:hypothetical protein
VAEGEFALIKQHLQRTLHTAPFWVGDHDLLAMLVDIAVQERDETAIQQYALQLEELAVRYAHILYQATAHRAWGVAHRLAGEYPQAEVRLNQALELFSGLNTRWQIGRTQLELGELAIAWKDTVKAQGHFALALAAFDAMGAAPDAARTRTRLEQI